MGTPLANANHRDHLPRQDLWCLMGAVGPGAKDRTSVRLVDRGSFNGSGWRRQLQWRAAWSAPGQRPLRLAS